MPYILVFKYCFFFIVLLYQIQIGWSSVDERNQGNSEYDINEKYENVEWECGGVLASENYVLSSAQCLRKKQG
jgi:hypothetical protein